MSKIGKLFKAAGMILRQPSLLNNVLDDNSNWKKRVNRNFGFETGLPTLEFKHFLDQDSGKVEPLSFHDGASPITDMVLLRSLAAGIKDCDYLEIGTWRGESVANVSALARSCVTLDLPEENLLKLGKDKNHLDQYAFFSKGLNNVHHIRQDSATFDFGSLQKKFDLVFVDGDHHYKGVLNDTIKVLPLLKDENSIIVWHDYAFHPEKIRWEVFSAILDGMPEDLHKFLFYAGETLSCVYSRRHAENRGLIKGNKNLSAFKIMLERT